MHSEAAIREPLILGHKTYSDITNDIVGPIENKAPRGWYILMGIASIIAAYGTGCILYLISKGIGTWGLNKTVDWAWDITNFVWWVGIGHAGTLISGAAAVPPEVAHGHQPLCRGDDHLRGDHGGGFSPASTWAGSG
jgi:hypothetical protein